MIRVIPAIDVMAGRVVRLYRGDPARSTTYGDDPAAVAARWEADGADMIHVVDLDAALGSGGNPGAVSKILDAVSIPVQVAGGLRTLESALAAARTADRVVVGTLAFSDRRALGRLLAELGPGRVVVSADHRRGEIVVRGWREGAGVMMTDAVRSLAGDGITEFLLTSVERDGTLQGPDLTHLEQACGAGGGGANVIASGGISGTGDVRAVRDAGAWGVILGRSLYDGRITIPGAQGALLR